MNKLKSLSLATHKKIYYILLLDGILTVAANAESGTNALNPWMLVGLLLIIGASAWISVFLRCPNCGNQFRWNQAIPKTCPKCGRKVS